jgi:hypothetical protein
MFPLLPPRLMFYGFRRQNATPHHSHSRTARLARGRISTGTSRCACRVALSAPSKTSLKAARIDVSASEALTALKSVRPSKRSITAGTNRGTYGDWRPRRAELPWRNVNLVSPMDADRLQTLFRQVAASTETQFSEFLSTAPRN